MYQKIREKSQQHQDDATKRDIWCGELYTSIFVALSAITKILLPHSKAVNVDAHLKSIMYDLIELKTGKRPKKF